MLDDDGKERALAKCHAREGDYVGSNLPIDIEDCSVLLERWSPPVCRQKTQAYRQACGQAYRDRRRAAVSKVPQPRIQRQTKKCALKQQAADYQAAIRKAHSTGFDLSRIKLPPDYDECNLLKLDTNRPLAIRLENCDNTPSLEQWRTMAVSNGRMATIETRIQYCTLNHLYQKEMLPWRRRTGTRSLDSHFRDLELDSAMYEGLTSNECRAVVMYDIATQSNISAVGERYRKRPGLSNLPRAFVRARTVPAAFCSLVLYGSYLVDDRTYTTGAITAADVSAACPQCTDPKALSWFKTWDSKACNKLIMDHQHFAPGESTPISDTWSSPDTSPSSAGETRPSPTDSSYEKAQADDEAVWAVVKRHARLIGKAAFPRYKVFQAEDIANGNNGFGHSVRYHQKDEYAPALYIWYEFKGRICTSSRIVKGSTRGKPFAEIDTVKRILLATLTVAKASKKPVVRAILRKIDKETDGVRLACHFLSIAALLE